MKLTVKNLGPIKEGTFDLSKDLIVFTGDNNTGKTYAAYLVYLFNRRLPLSAPDIQFDSSFERVSLAEIKKQILNPIGEFAVRGIKYLHTDFGIRDNIFNKTIVEADPDISDIEFNKIIYEEVGIINRLMSFDSASLFAFDSINHALTIKKENQPIDPPEYKWIALLIRLLRRIIYFDPLIVVAERGGVNLFANDVISRILRTSDMPTEFQEVADISEKYSTPIRDSISATRNFLSRNLVKNQAYGVAKAFESDLMEAETVLADDLTRRVRLKNGIELAEQGASSSIRSLSYIVNIIKTNRTSNYIIDEPELNLHPNRQSAFGRIMGQAVGQGSRFLITTHSDYIIREINILCQMFQNRDKLNLANFPEYTEDMLIDPKRVGMYYFDKTDGIVKELTFDKEAGFIIPSMDTEIERQNDTINKIYTYAFD